MERKNSNSVTVFLFAVWWFNQAETKEIADAKMPKFRSMMGKSKMLKADGFDLGLVQRAILTMRAQGIEVTTPYAIKWRSPVRGKTWYEYSLPLQPPVWDNLLIGLQADNSMPLRVS